MSTTATGHLVLVLHMHLPWVIGHGRWPHGQDWLHEATAESYIPTLRTFDRLVEDGISPKVTIGLTPVLAEMLASREFAKDFLAYVDERVALAGKDEDEFREAGVRGAAKLAAMWATFYGEVRRYFETCDADLIGQYRRLQKDGHIGVITSAATHGYLPLLGTDEAVAAQVHVGVETYRRRFRRAPRGIWLPECAYRPEGMWSRPTGGKGSRREGLEEVLARNKLRYFFVDTHLVVGGLPAAGPPVGMYEEISGKPPVEVIPTSGASPNEVHALETKSGTRVAVFARDPKSSTQVWSADYGYPGDGDYLEFHKRKGPGGLRYSRVTSRQLPLDRKEPYDPENAQERAGAHGRHFVGLVRETLAPFSGKAKRPGVVVAPFDAELFGHWWFEGPRWLETVLRQLSKGDVTTVTASEFVEDHPPTSAITLPEGSWGLGGHHQVWWNDDTRWVWEHVYGAEDAFLKFLKDAKGKRQPDVQRAIAQLARELLLLESSDWPFLITTWSARDYAEARVRTHAEAFQQVLAIARRALKGKISEQDASVLKDLERRDGPFADVDLRWWTES